jgi:peptide/nickel transport system permease protein
MNYRLIKAFWLRLLKEKPLASVGGGILLLLVLVALLADVLAPYRMDQMDLRAMLEGPSRDHWFGTDEIGRDLLSRVIHGARISITVGLVGAVYATALSTILGLSSGYFGGKFDVVLQRFVDSWMSFPDLFLALAILAVVGPGITQVIFVIGLLYAISGSRIIRGATIQTNANVYVEAARVVGCSNFRIMFVHILPNVMAPIIILLTTRMASMILVEASLSFLGYGIPPPEPSWGGMLSGAGRMYMVQNPWIALWPGIALGTVVYGINMFGDGLRDLLDPRLRGSVERFG